MAEVSQIEFMPPEGLFVSDTSATETTVTASVSVAPNAVLRLRRYSIVSLIRKSAANTVNVFTFQISSPRIGAVINSGSSLNVPVTVDFSDPTAGVSEGSLSYRGTLLCSTGLIIMLGTQSPTGRVPGTMGLNFSFSGLRGSSGALISFRLIARDGRESDLIGDRF